MYMMYNQTMIRKQLYLEEHQDRALKKRAKELGVSEAELVRRALNKELTDTPQSKPKRSEALTALFALADDIAKTHRFGDGYQFDRQALHEEDTRQTRWD